MSDNRPKFVSAPMKRRILAGNVPRWLRDHIRADYLVRCYLSTPLWVKRSDFNELARKKALETMAKGVPHVLDHIIPVTRPDVCGLTVPWNMHVITAKANAAKSNKWHPDQLPLALSKSIEQTKLF